MKTFSFLNPPIIVFSHLRWEFVTQRPQHIMQRLAKHAQILFVEEPIADYQAKTKDISPRVITPAKNITVVQPRVSWEDYGSKVGKYVRSFMRKHHWTQPRLWFYSPMFVEMIDRIPHSQVIYDCMDELAAFLGAPQELIVNERILLSKADVVFTGGRSLYESKKRYHTNAHCFPSSVDKTHFEKALSSKTEVPADLRDIPSPRVGFYGVVDERLDLQLLAEIAELNPTVSFVVIGPVVKIVPESLPQLTNIHYLGGKNYSELPAYLKGFDIAMMPFALNEATKFISPTKTLEFMAAKKPIVSTAIKDVAEVYPKEVSVANNALEFAQAIKMYLAESATERKVRERAQVKVVEQTSWDSTVKAMDKLMSLTDIKHSFKINGRQYPTVPLLNYSL